MVIYHLIFCLQGNRKMLLEIVQHKLVLLGLILQTLIKLAR